MAPQADPSAKKEASAFTTADGRSAVLAHGQAIVATPPDEIKVTFRIAGRPNTPEVDQTARARDIAIVEKILSGAALSFESRYSPEPHGIDIKCRVRDLALVEQLATSLRDATASARAGAERSIHMSIACMVDSDNPARGEARRQAAGDARSQAEAYARSTQTTFGPMFGIGRCYSAHRSRHESWPELPQGMQVSPGTKRIDAMLTHEGTTVGFEIDLKGPSAVTWTLPDHEMRSGYAEIFRRKFGTQIRRPISDLRVEVSAAIDIVYLQVDEMVEQQHNKGPEPVVITHVRESEHQLSPQSPQVCERLAQSVDMTVGRVIQLSPAWMLSGLPHDFEPIRLTEVTYELLPMHDRSSILTSATLPVRRPSIVVIGQGSAKVRSDWVEAVFYVNASNRWGEPAEAAIAQAADSLKTLNTTLDAWRIPKHSRVTMPPTAEIRGWRDQIPTDFVATGSVRFPVANPSRIRIKSRDIAYDLIPEVPSILQPGETRTELTFAYHVDTDNPARHKVRRLAEANARVEADRLAETFGVRAGRQIRILDQHRGEEAGPSQWERLNALSPTTGVEGLDDPESSCGATPEFSPDGEQLNRRRSRWERGSARKPSAVRIEVYADLKVEYELI